MTTDHEKHALKHPHSKIWAIAGPAILANSSAPLVGLVDTWAIGHLPDAVHLAAIGLAGSIFSFIFWMFGFLRMSTTGLVAQAHGAGDKNKTLVELVRATVIGAFFSIAFLLTAGWLRDIAFAVMNTPDDVYPYATQYFDIRMWAAPATLFFYSLNGYLIGTARAKHALALHFVLNISNAILNLLFVLGLNMGVEGVALGTVIAEWLTAMLGLFMLFRIFGFKNYLSAFTDKSAWCAERFKRLFTLNSYIFMRTLLLLTAFMLVTRTSAGLGQTALAASHVINLFLMLISLGLDGFAYAAEALAGAAYGTGNKASFQKWVKLCFVWAFVASVLYSILFAVAGESITAILTDLTPVQQAINDLLPVIVLLPIISVWCYQFDGIFIGVTAGSAMFATMLIAFTVYIPTLYILGSTYGLPGVWYSVIIFTAARGLAQAVWYRQLLKKLFR